MSVQDQPQRGIEVTNDSIDESVSDDSIIGFDTDELVRVNSIDTDLLMRGSAPPELVRIDRMDSAGLLCGSAAPQSHFTFAIGEQLPLLEKKITEPASTALNIENSNDSIIDWNIGPVTDADVTPPPLSTARIPRVPQTIREKHEYYQKYFVPKVVSIGPYHFGIPKLQLLQKRKPVIANKLISDEDLRSLYKKLVEPDVVKELRNFYEENEYSDEDFTKMMLLDSCFILYFINLSYGGRSEKHSELKSNEIFFVRRDLFLLENQIPFIVIEEVIKLINDNWLNNIKPFIDSNCFVTPWRPKRKWLDKLNILSSNFEEPGRNQSGVLDVKKTEHLLGAVHAELCKTMNSTGRTFDPYKVDTRVNFRNVTELVNVGIHFKPIKNTRSLTHIGFVKDWWSFSAKVKLPPVAVSDYTKPMLLNLMAYETSCCSIDDSWVTSYVCLLDSLIDDAEDVKVLRKAWVLENFLSSDKEVAELFNEIATELVPSSFAYFKAKQDMQAHYQSRRNALFYQLKNEYVKSPWAFLGLLGALIALFLTGVQTYFAVWSPKSTCDDLCIFLKMNHHL